MKQDLFEQKIKVKLEGLDKPIGANLWQKIERQVAKPWWLLFWRKYAWPMYAVLATGFLWYTFYQNTLISKNLSNLNTKVSKASFTNDSQKISYIRDTIYIEKTIYIKNEKQEINTKYKEKALEKYVSELKTEIKAYLGILENNYLKPSLENLDKINKENLRDLAMAVETSNKKVLESIEENPNTANMPKDSILIPEHQKEDIGVVLEKKKIFVFPNYETRFGITSDISFDRNFGIGPTFEWFVGKYLSFSLGTLLRNYPIQKYENTKFFNMETGQDFIKKYGSQINTTGQIEEIKIKTTVVEVPLKINYYYPLHQHWDLKFTYGTHLDLKSFQTLNAEIYSDGDEVYTKIQNKTKNSNLHNMAFGAGIQYHKNRYILQLIPSFTYHYRELDYQKTGSKFNLNGNLYIKLNR